MELLLRAFYPYPNLNLKGLYREDPEIGLRCRPNFTGRMKTTEYDVEVKINSSGYRDYERSIEPDAYKIMAIGDSFTFGCWVDFQDAYVTVLENLLNTELNRGSFQVVKMGGLASGSVQQYNLLKSELSKVKPDLVLIGFFVGNDFRDVMVGLSPYNVIDGTVSWKPEVLKKWEGYDVVRDQGFQDQPQTPSNSVQLQSPIRSYLRVNSHLYQYLGKLKYLFLTQFFRASPPSGKKASSPSIIMSIFWYESFYLKHYPKQMEIGVQQTLNSLENIKALCTSQNIDFLLVLIPVSTQIEQKRWDTLWNAIQGYYPNLSLRDIDREKPQKILTSWAEKHQVRVLDLLPKFKQYAEDTGKPLYYSIDPHWNTEGHYLGGKYIYEYIKTQILE